MRFVFAAATLFLALLSVTANAASLSVRLVPLSTSIVGNSDIVVRVEISNPSPAGVTVPVWQVPSEDLPRRVLDVRAADGTPARYVGPLIKWSPEALKRGVTFPAHSSRTFTIELSSLYEIGNGKYRIDYVQDDASNQGGGEKSAMVLSSAAPVFIQVRERSLQKSASPAPLPRVAGPSLTTYRCSTGQSNQVATAVNYALGYAQRAKDYFASKGNYSAAGNRYTTWFGTTDSERWGRVQTNFVNIYNSFKSQPVGVDCSCKEKDVYAYVYPNQPYLIYVCRAFWPASAYGSDSKAGTLIHEMSHFTVVAGTNDYAYGQSAAKRLAIRNPSKAIANADNHEYFAENTPPLN